MELNDNDREIGNAFLKIVQESKRKIVSWIWNGRLVSTYTNDTIKCLKDYEEKLEKFSSSFPGSKCLIHIKEQTQNLMKSLEKIKEDLQLDIEYHRILTIKHEIDCIYNLKDMAKNRSD